MRVLTDIDEVGRVVEDYKVVSFDVFDTLLFRNVPKPDDMFVLVSEVASCRGIHVDNFPQMRKDAEKRAAEKTPAGNDTTLDLIYSELNVDTEVRDVLKQAELDLERRLLVANKPMVDLANRLKAEGKIVVATSDMYLDSEFLLGVLKNIGLEPDRFYVSSEIGLRKSRGGLFEYALSDLGITACDMVHVGDNRLSDGIMPGRFGIASVLYRRTPNRKTAGVPNNATELVMHALASRSRGSNEITYESVGYSFLGHLLVGMCQWIKAEHDLYPDYELHFLSRDGYIVSKAYSILYPAEDTIYSYVSRRSLTVPLLAGAESFVDVTQIVPYIKRHETMESLLEKVGLDDQQLADTLKASYGNDLGRADMLDGKLDGLFKAMQEPMVRNAKSEKKCMDGYIAQEFGGKSMLVDVGWYGTIQTCLNRATGRSNIGLYLGLLKHSPEYSLGNAKGYAYDYLHGDVFDSSLVFSFNGLMETFFSAPHGSIRRYVQLADGTYGPVFAEKETANAEALEKMQNGAMQYVADYAATVSGLTLTSARSSYAFANMERLLTMPTADETALLGSLWFYDASYDPLICLHGASSYMRSPKSLVRDFLCSNWKAGWLRSVLHSGRFARDAYLAMNRAKGGK